MPHRDKARWGLVLAAMMVVVVAWLASGPGETSPDLPLVLTRHEETATNQGMGDVQTQVVPDFLKKKYSADLRAEFFVSSGKPVAIFVHATGVQVRTATGWHPYSEEGRANIWRLNPGTVQEMVVQSPANSTEDMWRAYVRYGTEMRGLRLFRALVREAWLTRSFANWTGKAWGGGRFEGEQWTFSEEFSK